MTDNRACTCAEQVTLHGDHCCLREMAEDHPIGAPLMCGHDEDFRARMHAADEVTT